MCTLADRISLRRAAAPGEMGAKSRCRWRAASAVIAMSPPEAPMASTRRPRNGPPAWKIFRVSHSVASDSQRAMPAWAQKASKAASAPASAPVCVRTVRLAASVRPVLTRAMGLPAARARAAACARRALSCTPSRYSPIALTRWSAHMNSIRSSAARRVWLPTVSTQPIGSERSLNSRLSAIVPLWQMSATPRSRRRPTSWSGHRATPSKKFTKP